MCPTRTTCHPTWLVTPCLPGWVRFTTAPTTPHPLLGNRSCQSDMACRQLSSCSAGKFFASAQSQCPHAMMQRPQGQARSLLDGPATSGIQHVQCTDLHTELDFQQDRHGPVEDDLGGRQSGRPVTQLSLSKTALLPDLSGPLSDKQASSCYRSRYCGSTACDHRLYCS